MVSKMCIIGGDLSPKNKKKTLLLAQDVAYARNLAANEEKVRHKSLKYLKKYLEQRSKASFLSEDNLKVIWKGLFYAMWMSDKSLIQEECAENIAYLIHCLQFDDAMLFFKIGLVTLQNEWIGIDQLRLDKFLMFVRRLLRQALCVLKKLNFRKLSNEVFAHVLEETILSVTQAAPLGLFMHFTEIYLEEIAKVSDGKLQSLRTLDLLKPYIAKLAFANDSRVIQWINKFIFTHLMKQHKLGLEYEDKYKIWRSHGFQGSINQIQKVIVPDEELDKEDSDDEKFSTNKALDPRAGKVDVELPQILFNAKDIAEALLGPKSDPRTSPSTRNHLSIWAEKFQKLDKGIYPIGVKKVESKKRKHLDNYDTNITKAAKRLIKFEQQLLSKENGVKKDRKRHISDSKDEEINIDIPKKKKKKNLQIESTNENDSGSSKERTRKETEESVKKSSSKGANKSKITVNIGENKSSKESELLTEHKKEPRERRKEKKLKPRKSDHLTDSVSVGDYFYCFERNSGVWHVTSEVVDKNVLASSSPVSNQLTVESTKGLVKRTSSKAAPMDVLNQSSNTDTEGGDDGGYDIYIPSKKFVKKLKKTKSEDEVEQILSKLRGKNKTRIGNLSLKQNPSEGTARKRSSTPGSPKKVVINTKLNISQDIDDHILHVISSPQIPWDSNKKPGKPLLKTPIKASPINPFYRLKTF